MTRYIVTTCILAGLIGWASASLPNVRGDEPSDTSSPIQLNFGAHLSPATAASLQIQAEAEYLRAYGQMQIDFAEARILHAEARKLEGENAMRALLDKIQKRDILEADRAKRIGRTLIKHRANYEKKLEQLRFHPELSANEINTGSALNFLKNRLSSNAITYHTASKETYATQDVSRQLRVTPEVIHALQVRQAVAHGESLVFRLDDGRSLQVDWWPPALRNTEIKSIRLKFERARNEVFEARDPDKFDLKIRELLLAHAQLEAAFVNQASYSWEKRRVTGSALNDYRDGKNVLRSLLAEIRRLEKLGPGQSPTRSLAFQGNDLMQLLTHMVRNGLEFAPAKPGDEPAYQQVFHMLRDLYAAAEADAEVPEVTTNAVIPDFPKRSAEDAPQ